MIDPQERWAHYGEKPDYLGLLTFSGTVYTEDPAELEGFDVAIVGAPMDDLVSDRPGARLAPRAIRGASSPPGPHLEAKLDAFAELRVVDFGDAPVVPADAGVSHAAIEATVGQVVAAGLLPVVLGGDHSISEPSVRAVAVGDGPVYLTVDVDVLDPAFVPGTGTPEPGGMTSVDLLLAVRTVAAELHLVGADVVEVIPTAIGSDDYSALVADRIVREALTGVALRRRR